MKQPERYLARERQFCSLCFAQGKGWVRIFHAAVLVELRVGRSPVVRHLAQVHPEAR